MNQNSNCSTIMCENQQDLFRKHIYSILSQTCNEFLACSYLTVLARFYFYKEGQRLEPSGHVFEWSSASRITYQSFSMTGWIFQLL